MTKKKQPTAASQTRKWFFPTLRKTVVAATYEEALTLATRQKKEREEGDDER